MPAGVWEFPVYLPRYAFSPRDVARAGDIWRALQEVAVDASSEVGWTPMRYRAEQSAFVVRRMVVLHRREIGYGDPIRACTGLSRFRRETLCTREIQLHTDRSSAEPSISLESAASADIRCTQHWVHVSPSMRPARAPVALRDAFPVAAELPAATELPSPLERLGSTDQGRTRWSFTFDTWHAWMDPLAHVNHPVYVDWCDEALSRRLAILKVDPCLVVPLGESMTYKRGITARQQVTVKTRLFGVGIAEEDPHCVHLEHHIYVGDDLAAHGTTIRTLKQGDLADTLADCAG
ncbi:MAG: hotdog domain-containing protein [Myxococcota bacterium]